MYHDTKIVSVSSGKVVTVPGPTTLNIPLELDNDTGAPNQVWRWVSVDDTWSKVVSKASGNLMDAPDAVSGDAPIITLADGSNQAAVIQCDDTKSPNQHWARDVISPCVFKLRVRSSQNSLEAPNYPSGTIPVIQKGASESQDQQWRLVLVDLGEEPFKIISRSSGKVLEVPNATTDDVPVGQNAETGATHQQWRLVPVAGGFFKIVSLSSQKVLDAQGSPPDGAPVIQTADTGAPSQQWRVLYAGHGYYEIFSTTSGKVLDVPGATNDNVPICQWADHGVPNQLWSIVPVIPPKNAEPGKAEPAAAAAPSAQPSPEGVMGGKRPVVLTPEAEEHVVSWAEMTTGIEDYARWVEMFEGRLGENDPPFRRGRIWA
ncbi:MAG: RICIN domain-containing protein [Planctomycetaceae bacterium]|nr:RICIN domain-containing protein [Planctomycetaceae bacterium]